MTEIQRTDIYRVHNIGKTAEYGQSREPTEQPGETEGQDYSQEIWDVCTSIETLKSQSKRPLNISIEASEKIGIQKGDLGYGRELKNFKGEKLDLKV